MLLRSLILGLRALAPVEPADDVAEPVVDIDWVAPPDCVEHDELVARTEALLGRPLGAVGDPDLELTGRIEADAEGLLLRLEFRRPAARVREFRGATCVDLLEAAAIVLAVTIDPVAPLIESPDDEPEPQPELEPESEPQPSPEPRSPEPELAQPNEAVPELGGFVRIAGGVQYPVLPGVAGGPSLALGLHWRALRAELVGALWLANDARFDEAPEVGARLSLGWVAPRVCGVPATRRVAFPLCAGLEVGGMRGSGFGTPNARTRTLAWVAAHLGAAASVDLGRSLALWAGIDAILPVTRPGFEVAGLGELHRAPAFAFEALLGLEIHFGGARVTDSRADGQEQGG